MLDGLGTTTGVEQQSGQVQAQGQVARRGLHGGGEALDQSVVHAVTLDAAQRPRARLTPAITTQPMMQTKPTTRRSEASTRADPTATG